MAERSLEVEGESEEIFEVEDEDEGALMEAYSSEEEVCKDSLATDHDVLSGAAIMKKEPKCLLVNLAANDFENFLSTVGYSSKSDVLIAATRNLIQGGLDVKVAQWFASIPICLFDLLRLLSIFFDFLLFGKRDNCYEICSISWSISFSLYFPIRPIRKLVKSKKI